MLIREGDGMLSTEFRAALEERVRRLEAASSVELCVAVRRQSGSYRDLDHSLAALSCLALLTALIYAPNDFHQDFLTLLLGAVYVLVLTLIPRFSGIYRRLAGPNRLRTQVLDAGRAAFVSERVASTRDRSGLLLYISWTERRALLLEDLGIDAHLGRGPLNLAESRWHADPKTFESSVLSELDTLATALGQALPRKEDDTNELADEVRILV